MTPQAERSPTTALPRWAVLTLLASLMINMLVVGVVGGRIWAHRHGHDHRDGGIRKFVGDLPEPRRQELGALLRAHRDAARASRSQMRTLRTEVREAMRREPFDKAVLLKALSRSDEARQALRSQQMESFAELIARMTPQERAAFAARRGFPHLGRH